MTYDGPNSMASVSSASATRERTSTTDGLGRLWKVVEDPLGKNYLTTYAYDLRDGLTSVTQIRKADNVADATQTRTFTYDSLGRLSKAGNPETGDISYTYDDDGNATKVTLASGKERRMSYNERHQVTGKNYFQMPANLALADTPPVTYCYDGQAYNGTSCAAATSVNANGRLTQVTSTAATNNYPEYDWLGRLTKSSQVVDSQSYIFYYGYSLGGQLVYQKYPSGREVSFAYDVAGQAVTVAKGATVGACTPVNGVYPCYASGITYAPHGGMQAATFGPLTHNSTYNSLLQVSGISASASNAAWSQTNTFFAPYNDGNIWKIASTGAQGGTVNGTYSYDSLGRLATESETGTGAAPGQTYEYDSVGNRWVKGIPASTAATGLSALTPTSADWYVGATNRLTSTGFTHDADGNLTAMQGAVLTYDAENRMVTSSLSAATQYWYDGEGRRVKKKVGTAAAVVYVYDAGGALAAEYGGESAATATQWLVTDHLGSTRMVVDAAGNRVEAHDYMPYGEEVRTSGTDGVGQKFTGQMRDGEMNGGLMQGLDFFEARYFSGATGRFTGADDPLTFADPDNPQSWNLYGYGLNNPLLYSDPSGHNPCVDGINPETGNMCVTGTGQAPGPSPVPSLMLRSFVDVFVTTAQVVKKTQELLQPAVDWVNTVKRRNLPCMAGAGRAGSTAGAVVGAAG